MCESDNRLVANSPLFDANWYLRKYPDVANAGMDPLIHYMNYGSQEGRNPSKDFDTGWYRSTYKDVSGTGIIPLVHYLRVGIN